MNNKGFFYIAAMIILAVAGFFVFYNYNPFSDSIKDSLDNSCSINEECVKVQTPCCPCSMGGVEKCVSKSEEMKYKELLESCPKDQACIQMYACQDINCSCSNGECVQQ